MHGPVLQGGVVKNASACNVYYFGNISGSKERKIEEKSDNQIEASENAEIARDPQTISEPEAQSYFSNFREENSKNGFKATRYERQISQVTQNNDRHHFKTFEEIYQGLRGDSLY